MYQSGRDEDFSDRYWNDYDDNEIYTPQKLTPRNIPDEQQGSSLKILMPDQMLSRLPNSLAQLKAGNNSEELKNEIRQLFYSLYLSKNK